MIILVGVHPPEGDALMRYRTEVLASEAGRGLLARRGSEAAGGGGKGQRETGLMPWESGFISRPPDTLAMFRDSPKTPPVAP